jgi:hypothetical protein
MAIRLASERPALPVLPEGDPAAQVAALPSVSGATEDLPHDRVPPVLPQVEGDDDDSEEIFDAPDGGDFYADAFEVVE